MDGEKETSGSAGIRSTGIKSQDGFAGSKVGRKKKHMEGKGTYRYEVELLDI